MILIWLSLESVQGCAICNGSLHAKIFVSWRQLHLNTHLHLPTSLCIHYFHLTAAKVQADDAKMHWYYWGWSLLQLRMILSSTGLSCPDVRIVRYTHTCHYHHQPHHLLLAEPVPRLYTLEAWLEFIMILCSVCFVCGLFLYENVWHALVMGPGKLTETWSNHESWYSVVIMKS